MGDRACPVLLLLLLHSGHAALALAVAHAGEPSTQRKRECARHLQVSITFRLCAKRSSGSVDERAWSVSADLDAEA